MRREVIVDDAESAADHTRMKQEIGTVLPCYTIQLPYGEREDAIHPLSQQSKQLQRGH